MIPASMIASALNKKEESIGVNNSSGT